MEEKEEETRIDRSIINSPSHDIDNIYSWQQIIVVSADQELIMTKIQEKENNGYTLVNNNLIRQSGVSSYPLALVFRKRKEENNN
jgi:LysM repeat protein